MKMKYALASALIATLAAVGSLAPAPSQMVTTEAQGGFAFASIGSHFGWWGPDGYVTAISTSAFSAGSATVLHSAGTALGVRLAISGGRMGAMMGAAAGPAGLVLGAAIGAM